MLRAKELQDKLLPLIGWAQNYNISDLKISEYLTKSESGIYFQQIHPLLTLQNLSCIAPDFKNMQFLEYERYTTYEKGRVVSYNDELYKAVENTQGELPGETLAWVKTDPFSEWLEDKTKASIIKALTRYCNEKLENKTQKTLCENKILFEGTGRIVDTIKNRKNLVGFEIVPVRAKGITTKINKIGLQFTEPGRYTLYLMHSSSETPVKVISLEKTRKNSIEWFSIDDLFLPYQSDETDAGGSWYLCYSQSELPEGSQAIKKDKDWSKGPCSSCSRGDYLSWQAWSKYLEVHPFYVNEESAITEEGLYLWDIAHNNYTYNSNYGLNLEVSVHCDITDFIVEQRELFQDVIAKQVAVDMLKELAYNANVRANRHAISASRLDIMYELDGDSTSLKKSGLNYQLDLAFKALNISTQGLNRVCLPCKNNGIKYRTV